MAFYWRLQDIPELRDLTPKDRRKWWREAVTESRDGRDIAIKFGVLFCVALAAGALATQLGYKNGWVHSAVTAGPVTLVVLIVDHPLVQPKARRWLQANLARQMAREQKLNAN